MNRAQIGQPTPTRLVVTAWADPVIEALGHRPGSAYIEAVWLSVLGPTATWAWQRLARVAAVRPGAALDTVDLAVSLGLGERLGHNAPISRTLSRLVAFDTARRAGDTLAVRVALPDLPAHRASRLSVSARLAHHRLAHQTVAGKAVATGGPHPDSSPTPAAPGIAL